MHSIVIPSGAGRFLPPRSLPRTYPSPQPSARPPPPAATLAILSFRAEQADSFFRVRSRERILIPSPPRDLLHQPRLSLLLSFRAQQADSFFRLRSRARILTPSPRLDLLHHPRL